MVTRWSHSTSTFYVLIGQNWFMCKIFSIWKLVYWWLKLIEFVSSCNVFNCLFPLDVQNEIQLLSRIFLLFMSGLFIRFLFEKYAACQSHWKSYFRWHLVHLAWCGSWLIEDDCYSFGVHISLLTRCLICFTLGLFANYFSLKLFSLSLKSHMNVFDLNYTVINLLKINKVTKNLL